MQRSQRLMGQCSSPSKGQLIKTNTRSIRCDVSMFGVKSHFALFDFASLFSWQRPCFLLTKEQTDLLLVFLSKLAYKRCRLRKITSTHAKKMFLSSSVFGERLRLRHNHQHQVQLTINDASCRGPLLFKIKLVRSNNRIRRCEWWWWKWWDNSSEVFVCEYVHLTF